MEELNIRQMLEEKGFIDEKISPDIKLVEEIERRIQATKRHLQINSAATNGPSHHQTGKNATARHLATVIADTGSDLIPRPR